jgi:hypothetical protein
LLDSTTVNARSTLLFWSSKASALGHRRRMAASAQLDALKWVMRRAWRRLADAAAILSVRSAVTLWWASQAAAAALGRWHQAIRYTERHVTEARASQQRLSSREAAWRQLANRSAARHAVAWWRAAVAAGLISSGRRSFPRRLVTSSNWTDPLARQNAVAVALAWDVWAAWRCGQAERGAWAARAREYARAAGLVEPLARWRSHAAVRCGRG